MERWIRSRAASIGPLALPWPDLAFPIQQEKLKARLEQRGRRRIEGHSPAKPPKTDLEPPPKFGVVCPSSAASATACRVSRLKSRAFVIRRRQFLWTSLP